MRMINFPTLGLYWATTRDCHTVEIPEKIKNVGGNPLLLPDIWIFRYTQQWHIL